MSQSQKKQLIETNMNVSFNERHGFLYEFHAILSANLFYCITNDQTYSLNLFYQGYFFYFLSFLCPLFNAASSAAPRFHWVQEDAGVEPRTVANLELTVGRFNHSARSHPLTYFFIILGSKGKNHYFFSARKRPPIFISSTTNL